MSGRVEEPAVKEEHVAGLELDCGLCREQRAIFGDTGAKKLRGVELLRSEIHGVAPRENEQAAISEMLAARSRRSLRTLFGRHNRHFDLQVYAVKQPT